jgi:hypothetical protein
MISIIDHFRADPEQIAEFLKKRNLDPSDCKDYELCFFPKNYKIPQFVKDNMDYYKSVKFLNENGELIIRDRIGIPMVCETKAGIQYEGIACRDISGESNNKYLTIIGIDKQKGSMIYSPKGSFKAIIRAGWGIVTEGQLACIMLQKHGIKNCISTYSANFSRRHAELLSKVSDTYILTFDDDTAGRKASITGWINSIGTGLKLKFLNSYGLNEHSGADDYLLKHGKKAFDTLLDSSHDISHIFYNLSDSGKEKLVEKVKISFNAITEIEYLSDVFLKFSKDPKSDIVDVVKKLANTFEKVELFSYVANPDNELYNSTEIYAMLYWLSLHKKRNKDMKDRLPYINEEIFYLPNKYDMLNIFKEARL